MAVQGFCRAKSIADNASIIRRGVEGVGGYESVKKEKSKVE